jgi:uncharacterized SAM-binding protein YcdF (DUF218 family)
MPAQARRAAARVLIVAGGQWMRVLGPALIAVALVTAATALLALTLRSAVAEPLLVSAAAIATLGLGGASLWHALVLPRLVRVRRTDVLIALLGAGMLLLATAIAVAAALAPSLARALLLLALPVWAAGLAFAVLVTAMVLHARRSRSDPPTGTVLILGAGLRGRAVGPLLRRRVERGAELWRQALADRPDARILVAGGRGHDEVRTEASAMAEHLERQLGVPAEAIDLEERSTSTRENLELSRPLIVQLPLAVVTSEYHAYRTAWLLARAGIAGTVVGAWTRPSYRPGAAVREALAIAAGSRRWCLGIALLLEAIAVWALIAQP